MFKLSTFSLVVVSTKTFPSFNINSESKILIVPILPSESVELLRLTLPSSKFKDNDISLKKLLLTLSEFINTFPLKFSFSKNLEFIISFNQKLFLKKYFRSNFFALTLRSK